MIAEWKIGSLDKLKPVGGLITLVDKANMVELIKISRILNNCQDVGALSGSGPRPSVLLRCERPLNYLADIFEI